MTVEITITSAEIDATVFDLYSNTDGFITPFEIGVPVMSLLSGYTTSLVPDYTSIIRVKNANISACNNFKDVVLNTTTTTTSSTTTTTTTLLPSVACNTTTTSGGTGVTEYQINLNTDGGVIILDFQAYSVPDKIEILHNGLRVATSGMSGINNSGPFDTLYGDPDVPSAAAVASIPQFIGSSKGSIPGRDAEFISDTGIVSISRSNQQLVWWSYDNANYNTNPIAIVRITGAEGTAWKLDRLCQPEETTTTTTTAAPTYTPFSVSAITGSACSNPDLSPYSETYYHNGVGAYPVIGDTIFYDSTGVSLVVSMGDFQMGNLEYLRTDGLGVMVIIDCK